MKAINLTREEAIKRWKTSKETKQKMAEKLEQLVRTSYMERTGKEPTAIEIW